jgi:eukaryotic-like serine/threonine-protein kinase
MYAALARGDGRAVLEAAGRIPDYQVSFLLMIRGRGAFLARDYAAAENLLRRAIFAERNIESAASTGLRSPLMQMICRFYLGQVYEATGKHEQAIGEYREFLSRFEGSPTRLPQVTDARAAQKRLV